MSKFKKNDVVVLNNPTMCWPFSTKNQLDFMHGQIGIVTQKNNYMGRVYSVLHVAYGDSEPLEWNEHESDLIKIGTL